MSSKVLLWEGEAYHGDYCTEFNSLEDALKHLDAMIKRQRNSALSIAYRNWKKHMGDRFYFQLKGENVIDFGITSDYIATLERVMPENPN